MSHESTADISFLAALACILEATAPKPGNVSPGRPFRDMSYSDFVASALAAGPELALAGERSLGDTILAAVRATRMRTRANTNLGIILLFAPLIAAAKRLGDSATRADLQESLRSVLRASTVEDAAAVYAAIREAKPGGLGTASEQDLSNEPSVTLLEAMRLAAGRDEIAAEYAGDFPLTFGVGAPAVLAAREGGLGWDDAVVETFLTLLAHRPDSLDRPQAGRGGCQEGRLAGSRDPGGRRRPFRRWPGAAPGV